MNKILIILLIISSFMFSKVLKNQMLEDRDITTDEYQLFITNTKNISLNGLTKKEVYNGNMKEYYDNNLKMVENNLPVSKELANVFSKNSQLLGNAIASSNFKNIQDFSVVGLTVVAGKMLFGSIFSDEIYIQVFDYYDQNNNPKTRLIKYLISDRTLNKEEKDIIFNTTNDESHHYRNGAFVSMRIHYVKEKKDVKNNK